MNANFPRTILSRNLGKYNVVAQKTLLNNFSAPQNCQCSMTTICTNLTSKQSFLTEEKTEKRYNNLTEVYKRCLSTENNPSVNKLPPLMNFPRIVWPSMIKTIRNFILSTFIIKPYLDRDFNLHDFMHGSKKAVEVVSHNISAGDLKKLKGLVAEDIIPNLQQNVSLMSLSQREQIAISVDDIYFSFPYQIGVIFNDDEGKEQKRFVEITMVYHTLKGLAAMRDRGEEPPYNVGMIPEYQHRISICNYRFIREFTKGVEDGWTVNLLNHFKPADG